MTSTANPELRAFQIAVRDKIDQLAAELYWHGGAQVKADLGLDNLVEDVEVTVKVTVPAADQATAVAAVQDQVRFVHLPSGWAAEVSA